MRLLISTKSHMVLEYQALSGPCSMGVFDSFWLSWYGEYMYPTFFDPYSTILMIFKV